MRHDSFFMRWFSRIGDFLGLTLLWILCCLPLLTFVPSSVALYDTVAHCFHGGEDGPYRRFFRTFRAELLRGMGLTALWAVIFLLLIMGYRITAMTGDSTIAAVYSMLYAGTLLIPLAVFCWVIPIQSRFSYGFFQLHQVALTFTVAHLPTTAGILGIGLVSMVILAFIPPLVILMPCITVTVQSWLIEKVLVQYMPEEDDT